MSDDIDNIIENEKVLPKTSIGETGVVLPVTAFGKDATPEKKFQRTRNFSDRGSFGRKRSFRSERVKPEYEQKVLNIRRVARVTAGGKRFNLSLVLAIGNRRGSVGVGTGKGADTALAMEKALRDAKKNLVKVNITKGLSIPHSVSAKYSSALVFLIPAPRRGLIAGSALRDILGLAGIHNVNGKILSGSKNKLNIARAAIKALSQLSSKQKLNSLDKKSPQVKLESIPKIAA